MNKLRRKLIKLRLQPIRVFCFHQVSEQFDASTMWECDWTQIDQFKRNVLCLKSRYTFISLSEAHAMLKKDWLRCKKYAVMTCDDGWMSIKNIVPWLAEQQIPVTLFVNPAYLLGEEVRENNMSGLLSNEDIATMIQLYPNITIASHGWNHQLATQQTNTEFCKSVEDSVNWLKQYHNYIPYFAYPCGRHKKEQDVLLLQRDITPVYCDGDMNYNDFRIIHRDSIDGKLVCSQD